MRFNIFFTLFVATFIVSCDSFISAKTYSLDDRTFDSTEVHHLRGNDDIQEERGGELGEAISHGLTAVRSSASPKYVDMTADELTDLAKKISDTHNLLKLSNTDMAKLMAELAVVKKEKKEKWPMITKVFIVLVASVGISFALSALFELLTPYGA
ncbi:unnamed protein product [Peronospora farinosa]|uniref:RxLR effector protein n=1 Tax=Peronospora farinosa TaxID=134698 RepID=A0AAV0U8X4_9STRA|nr:unnamed protein product [Peronospora farinosa]CAI5733370.1 unnamed protein product [Peronospora farinosa]